MGLRKDLSCSKIKEIRQKERIFQITSFDDPDLDFLPIEIDAEVKLKYENVKLKEIKIDSFYGRCSQPNYFKLYPEEIGFEKLSEEEKKIDQMMSAFNSGGEYILKIVEKVISDHTLEKEKNLMGDKSQLSKFESLMSNFFNDGSSGFFELFQQYTGYLIKNK